MGIISRIRDKVDEVVDREKSEAKRMLIGQPKQKAQRESSQEYSQRTQYINDRRSRGEISRDLAEKWHSRAKEKYEKQRLPARERAYNWLGSGDQKTPGNWAEHASENFNRTFTGGYETYTDRHGNVKERRRLSPKERVRNSIYGNAGRGGASKSYRKTVPREFGIARNENQFGNILLTGSATRGAKKIGGGWGMMYGARSGVRSFDSSSDSTSRRSRRGRRSSGRGRSSAGSSGWLF